VIPLDRQIAVWHAAKFPNVDRYQVLAKLTEEVGELARAVIAEDEGRPGRGDPRIEAAQVAVVLCALIGRWWPDFDLTLGVRAELARLAA